MHGITRKELRLLRDIDDGVLMRAVDKGLVAGIANGATVSAAGGAALKLAEVACLRPASESDPHTLYPKGSNARSRQQSRVDTRPLFEHRQFQWLAAWCAEHVSRDDAGYRLVCRLSSELAETNDRFDGDRFLAFATGRDWRETRHRRGRTYWFGDESGRASR